MTAMTDADDESRKRTHTVALTAAMIVLFWGLAAFLVFEMNRILGAVAPVSVAFAKVVVIVAAAWVYMRLAGPRATVGHALLVGVVWFALDIGTEIAMTFSSHREWFVLLGSPSSSALRVVLLAAWVGAPALFARYSSVQENP